MKSLLLKLFRNDKFVGYEQIVGGRHYQSDSLPVSGAFCIEDDNIGEYYLFDSFEIIEARP